jgi:hypothetical protein
LRDLAAQSPALSDDLSAAPPAVLITVQTVGQTGDLLRLLKQISSSEQGRNLPADAAPASRTMEVQALPDSSGRTE